MAREICLFDKFSYCKNGEKCVRIHLKEVCLIRECDYRRCDKRHPRPCKIFRIRGFCRFGTNCRYSHRLPKEVEDQNNKINSLEVITEKLSKQVSDQNNEIKDLKIKLVESENRTLKILQQQIDALVESNDQKEKAIKNLERDGQEQGNTVDEQEQTYTLEEAVVREERCEVEDSEDQWGETLDGTPWGEEQERGTRFVADSLSILTDLENHLIYECRKNGKIRHKYRLSCDQILKKGGERLDPLNYSTHKDFIDLVKEIKLVITKSEKEKRKFDKDDCIKIIEEFRERLDQLDPITM